MRINTITKAFRLFFVNPKSFFLKFKSFIRYLINAYLKKDFHTLEYKRWYYDNGDQTLRLNYPSLNNSSIVFDLGGYLGDFAMEYLIENNILEIVKNYQIQFHKFVPGSINRRKKIINELNKKFKQTWCYEFVWENWTHN